MTLQDFGRLNSTYIFLETDLSQNSHWMNKDYQEDGNKQTKFQSI